MYPMLLCYDMLYMYVCMSVHVRRNIGGKGGGREGSCLILFSFFPLFNIYIYI